MNSYAISLSSATTNIVSFIGTTYLTDVTNVTIDLLGVYDKILTSRILIDWGDGSPIENYDRSFFKDYKTDSIFPEILYGKESVLLSNTYSHVFYSSDSTLQLVLTAQLTIVYTDNNQARFVIPISISSGSFYDTIYDLSLVGTNLLPLSTNPINFVFAIEKDGYIIESTNQ